MLFSQSSHIACYILKSVESRPGQGIRTTSPVLDTDAKENAYDADHWPSALALDNYPIKRMRASGASAKGVARQAREQGLSGLLAESVERVFLKGECRETAIMLDRNPGHDDHACRPHGDGGCR